MNEKTRPSHLSRKAFLYIRQSSPYQVAHYKESQRLQYGMRAQLERLGWQDIEVIDEDLGRTASGVVERTGFDRMVAEVCLGKVGVVAARELSRFARNSREWQRLIEVCRVVDTLLLDQEMIYDARRSNDRLLLGLKGSLNEYELDVLRMRSLEARKQKASRGELIVNVPVGYVKVNSRIEKTPDQRVQQAVRLVFEKFLELGSARQTLSWFLDEELKFPALQYGEAGREIEWKRPRYTSIMHVLQNPAYAGMYVYGRSKTVQEFKDGVLRKRTRSQGSDRWAVSIPEHHEGYIRREDFERIQAMLTDNAYTKPKHGRGPVRRGPALLVGLLRCGRCGRKLIVTYTGKERTALRYACHRGHLDIGEARCLSFGGVPLDEAVGREVLKVVQPGAIQAAVVAYQESAGQRETALKAVRLELQEARYEAERARRQYHAVDPENRLVAAELETRWNTALERVSQLEQKVGQAERESLGQASASLEEFKALAVELPAIWNNQDTDIGLKKRIARTLIEEIVVDSDHAAGLITPPSVPILNLGASSLAAGSLSWSRRGRLGLPWRQMRR